MLTLSGMNTFTGDTTVSQGTLLLGNASALPNSTVNMAGGTLRFGSLSSAFLGGLKGTQDLPLTNGVGLVVGLNNQSTAYSAFFPAMVCCSRPAPAR